MEFHIWNLFRGSHFQLFMEPNKPVNHVLIPWIRVLLEKLTVSQLVKKFPAFYGIQINMYITYLFHAAEAFLRS